VIAPQGIAWETFHTTREITSYGEDSRRETAAKTAAASCCASKLELEVKPASTGCYGPAARRRA
jgi:hypothetical protein